MYHIFCIHSSVVGHLGCFQLLGVIIKASVYIIEHVPLRHGGATFGYMPKSSIAGSLCRFIANFLRNLQIDFQSGCSSLRSDQQWRLQGRRMLGGEGGEHLGEWKIGRRSLGEQMGEGAGFGI